MTHNAILYLNDLRVLTPSNKNSEKVATESNCQRTFFPETWLLENVNEIDFGY